MNEKYLFLLKTKPYKCEKCGISNWQNKPITLEIHHIDGNHNNNDINNLQLLCPNCHSQTENYRKTKVNKTVSDETLLSLVDSSKDIKELLLTAGLSTSGANYKRVRTLFKNNNVTKFNKDLKINHCLDCGCLISPESIRCPICNKQNQQKQSLKPTREILKTEIRSMPFTQIGLKYSVTDNAVRKWCKGYNLPYTKKEINKYSDEDWLLI